MIPGVRFGKIAGQIGGVPVRMVNAEAVRLLAPEPDFVVGGHGYVYPKFIPRGEIWLDDTMEPQAVACSALHEAVERHLQKRRKMSYDRAHNFANGVEQQLRADLMTRGLREKPLVVAGRWYARWFRTHRDKLAA